MSERIETVRSMFRTAGHDVDAITFARSTLAASQDAVRQAAARGVVAVAVLAVLDLALGDPAAAPAEPPVQAYVNKGRWLAKCECGGAEYVDLELPLFMCCGCWNREFGHAWRAVVVPAKRDAIERVLLARAKPNRNWRPGESLLALARDNRAHGVPMLVEVA